MKNILVPSISLMAMGLVACSSGTPVTPASPDAAPWSYESVAGTLGDLSCPNGAAEGFAMSFVMAAEPVELGEDDKVADALTGLSFRAGWALDAPLASFGGLSGLDILPGGDLLAVSDAGALVAIPFDQEALVPRGQATLTYLRNQDGEVLTGKADADAEGLHVRDGAAFVSFERNHRVAAYAFDRCGGNAAAVPIARMGDRPTGLGRSISENSGSEGLVMMDDALLVGIETLTGGKGPIGRVTEAGGISFAGTNWVDAEGAPLVGLDEAGGRLYSLHRAYNPLLRQNTISIRVRSQEGETKTLAFMGAPLALDNFEAIAVMPLASGEDRIFILSDDNFSDNQRTLLYVFETVRD
ncbi:esterase-like activity of phytase family protein [Henriciella marina]|uniref:esterase-like activity of phytase family protein n=1 Tax=Henriciella marina TaxID=453851 RepID=UPI00035F8272|nr:esterase-like activity of phytase family protein [Henriciella marina]